MAVNQWLVTRNWLVGAYLVEYEQNGSDRANYGTKLLERLAEDLAATEVKGLEIRNLRNCRRLFLAYPQIRQTVSAELLGCMEVPDIRQTLSIELRNADPIPSSVITELAHTDGLPEIPYTVSTELGVPIRQTLSAELRAAVGRTAIPGTLSPEFKVPIRLTVSDEFKPAKKIAAIRGGPTRETPTPLSPQKLLEFSWSKLQELLQIDDPWKRAFYENECLKGHWSVRQLQRQIESLLYERTGLSTNKKSVIKRGRKQEPRESIEELIRDPYVLEFAGLAERPAYTENDLETALLDHLQNFLLEMGNGFCFEARQYRITTGNRHHRVDMVFYHRLLRCHVLIDLKIRAFKHEDAGQMNFYVNWFKKNQMNIGDSAPVGIILCSGKDHTDVEFATAGMDAKLFVSRYLVALPSAEQLKALLEADRACSSKPPDPYLDQLHIWIGNHAWLRRSPAASGNREPPRSYPCASVPENPTAALRLGGR